MRFCKLILFCSTVLIMSSCGNKGAALKASAPSPKKTLDIQMASLSTPVDPVCGMTLKQGEVGDTTTLDGKMYGFCGTGCKDEFVKDPAKYLNQK